MKLRIMKLSGREEMQSHLNSQEFGRASVQTTSHHQQTLALGIRRLKGYTEVEWIAEFVTFTGVVVGTTPVSDSSLFFSQLNPKRECFCSIGVSHTFCE
jgi:hypothetical protein